MKFIVRSGKVPKKGVYLNRVLCGGTSSFELCHDVARLDTREEAEQLAAKWAKHQPPYSQQGWRVVPLRTSAEVRDTRLARIGELTAALRSILGAWEELSVFAVADGLFGEKVSHKQKEWEALLESIRRARTLVRGKP